MTFSQFFVGIVLIVIVSAWAIMTVSLGAVGFWLYLMLVIAVTGTLHSIFAQG